ncbi:putative Ig domain protein [Enhygromyxa salina]|uniref:Putative Ig domain protein n=1 Tax=Enhygromyxa salina TaxID=215803 RepID=A0A2S9XBM9_9BACT|nr:Ig domain-containing protein [Enhygromyxa salina]PRP90255.1 putative Ig domain protein [Enhygromyxa salina]
MREPKNFPSVVRTVGLGLPILAVLTVASSCSRDALAPDCFEIDPDTGICLVPDPGGTAVGVDCEMFPDGAVGATYSFIPPVGGGSGNYSNWMATNLPPGLSIDPNTGEIMGVPEPPGNMEYQDITITVFDEGKGQSFDASCGPLLINEPLNSNAVLTEPMHCIPHTSSRDEMIALLGGGDGTQITCSAVNSGDLPCPLGDGNGRLPPGITFNDSSCTHSGNITGERRGTWVWMVEIEQSGFKTRVPFCASNDVDTFHDITVTANAVEESDLKPGLLEFDPNAPLLFGDGSYVWDIEDPACNDDPALCNSYGFRYDVTCSPFDPPFALNAESSDTGMTHGMTAMGPTPSAGFATRPFVASFEMLYCTSDNGADCDVGSANFDQNAQTKYHFDVVGYPVAGNP